MFLGDVAFGANWEFAESGSIKVASMSDARVCERILVADDDRPTRFAISSMLKKAGYAVTAVKDGAEALHNIQQTKF